MRCQQRAAVRSESLTLVLSALLGMMGQQNLFFTAFLFGGFLLPEEDMVWPFKIFFYIMPVSSPP